MCQQTRIDDLPILAPVIDIHTVGAGGGSIAWVDDGGALRAGPQSAGATPGPACYGQGGIVPTVTDANLLRGHLHPDYFLGGTMSLSPDAAHHAIAPLAQEIGLDPLQASHGICTIANAVMERALKVISVARGRDPRDLTLVTFGGAGGMHACDLANALGLKRILVPPHPGLLSAVGMLFSDVQVDLSQTVMVNLRPQHDNESGWHTLNEERDKLILRANSMLKQERIAPPQRSILTVADLRYKGQSFELQIPWSQNIRKVFDQAHQRRYGYCLPHEPVEVVTLRAKAIGHTQSPRLPRADGKPHTPSPQATTQIYIRGQGLVPAALYDRTLLMPHARIEGPALVVEYSSTTTVLPGWNGRCDSLGNLILETRGPR